jgi:broad specificity phosphatase PhoE
MRGGRLSRNAREAGVTSRVVVEDRQCEQLIFPHLNGFEMLFKRVSACAALLAISVACATSPRASGDAAASASVAQTTAAPVTTVIVVRHAEKADNSGDPELSAAGAARAQALVNVVRDAKVSRIITTQFRRTRATAEPTATALGVTPTVIPATATHVSEIADTVRAHRGATFLIVGHSNTVPAIVAALGAPSPAPICDSEYDNLFVVTLNADGKPPVVVQTHYGAASERGGGCPAMR